VELLQETDMEDVMELGALQKLQTICHIAYPLNDLVGPIVLRPQLPATLEV
jgi:hypothetical protein